MNDGPARPSDERWQTALEAARRIAEGVAGVHAGDVDSRSRFPSEALSALKEARLLSALIPEELGGMGRSIAEVSEVCFILGQHCAATAMIFAMHQIQVATLVRHGLALPYFRRYLQGLSERQNLIASVTSEVGVGGDMRSSVAAITPVEGGVRVDKDATTISYGEHADELLVTIRRAPDAPAGDQVLVLIGKSQYTLERTSNWDTLGMRGTCSPGFKLRGLCSAEQVLPNFPDVSARTMVPVSHITWSHLWLGIATDAVNRARAFVRGEARKKPGTTPPGALRLAELSNDLSQMRAVVHEAAREYQAIVDAGMPQEERLSTMGYAIRINNLKLAASQAVPEIVLGAFKICGISGYKNDTKFSLGRHLRDAHSAALMISNDRIHATNASLLLVSKDD